MRATRGALLGASAGCAAGFALVTWAAYETAAGRDVDVALLEPAVAVHGGLVEVAAEGFADLLAPIPFAVLLLALLLTGLRLGRRREATAAGALVVLSVIASQILKATLSEPRPWGRFDGAFVHVEALPSGHATAAMALALGALVVAPPAARRAVAAAGALLVIAESFSVMSLGWHFASDVLCGWLLAAGWAALVLAAVGVAPASRRRERQPVG